MTMDPLNGENEIDIELARTAFSVEHFRRMIKKTFTDFHPGQFNLHNIHIDAYLKVVEQQELCAKYGSLLEGERNILNIKTVPWFDLGDLPESYDALKDEAFQVTMAPK